MELGKKVLIVDDDPVTLYLISTIVSEMGLHPLLAENGREALELLRIQKDVLCIFSDIVMPVMDGPSMIKKIHKKEELKTIPIILFSGELGFKEAGKYLKNGVVGFMEKPIVREYVRNTLKVFLQTESIAVSQGE